MGHEEGSELLGGFIRMHILHHATQGPIYGLWIIEELHRHGYRLSPGTLYPILHSMGRSGYLRSRAQREGRSVRRVYSATAKGRRVLATAKLRLQELFGEIIEH